MKDRKRSGSISGKKFCRHTTVTQSARKVAEVLNRYQEVTKISNGYINGKGRAQFSLKFIPIHGGWTIHVHGSHAMQELHIYTNDPDATRRKIEETFPDSHC